jgi:hypothetical protein
VSFSGVISDRGARHVRAAQRAVPQYNRFMRTPSGDEAHPTGAPAYRNHLDAALAKISRLERENDALAAENRALTARFAVPGALARVDTSALPLDARRRVIQRRVRAIRRELRAAFGIRRYAASAIIAVTAAAAFVVMAAESMASWPLAIAILGIGAVARGLLSHWPGIDEIEDRRRKLAALKSQLDEIRAAQRNEPPPALAASNAEPPLALDPGHDV